MAKILAEGGFVPVDVVQANRNPDFFALHYDMYARERGCIKLTWLWSTACTLNIIFVFAAYVEFGKYVPWTTVFTVMAVLCWAMLVFYAQRWAKIKNFRIGLINGWVMSALSTKEEWQAFSTAYTDVAKYVNMPGWKQK